MSNNTDDKQSSRNRSWLERVIALLAREPKNREELMEILRNAEDREVVTEEHLSMIERILQVSEMQVREVMIPKAQMTVVRKDNTLEKLLPIVIESAHSRFPVIDPKNKDVVGILLAKDLLKFCAPHNQSSQNFNMNEIIRPAVFTSQNKKLDILLREFRINRYHMAIVLDEYGYVVGLVTIEDLLEQIVGDIEDEYDIDEDEANIKKLDDGTYIVKASTDLHEFNQYFQKKFGNKEQAAIGDVISEQFEETPKRGDITKLDNFRFKILHSDNHRIYLLEVRPGRKRKENES